MFSLQDIKADKLTLFNDATLEGHFLAFLEIETKVENGHHNKRWARRGFAGDREQVISLLDAYHLDNPQAITDLKSKYSDLLQAAENAKATIATQDQAIADCEQSLTASSDEYAVAVIARDNAAITAIEGAAEEVNRQIKLAQVRKSANQLVIDKLQKYIYVIDGMVKALELADLRRDYQAEVDSFSGVREAFIKAFKGHVQRCEAICPGVARHSVGYSKDDTARRLFEDLCR